MNKRQKLVQQQFLNDEASLIGKLRSVYSESLGDITKKIEDLTFTIGELQERYEWLDVDDPERARIKSRIQSKIYQRQYQEQLQKQVDGILTQMRTKQYTTVSAYLDECYKNGFVGSLFDLHGQGVPLTMPINQEAMVRAVQLDSKISQGLYTRLGEDVALLKKKITSEVTRAISSGMTFQQTARLLSGQTNIGFNNAVRIARTEGHRIQCQSAMDAMSSAKDSGADILKQWDSTLDAKTRESHVAVDMEVRELNKPFSNGLMFPGDPSGGASEVINCRCSLDQRARWALEDDDQSFTKFNGFTEQIEEFESPETYDEFKKAFFSPENRAYMDYVQRMEERYATRHFPTVLESMTEREYKGYSNLLGKNPLYRKKRTDEGVFTTLNATKADSIRPKSVMNEMRKSETGRELLDYIVHENVPVYLCYGVEHEECIRGIYDPIEDVIKVYCDETKTIEDTALTVIHEATHRKLNGDDIGSWEEEVECFKAEVLHQKGHLTKSDIDAIIERVKRDYPEFF